MSKQPDARLFRSLGVWSAAAVIVGDMIGTGIFLVTGDMARLGGTTHTVFLAWILGGLLSACGAFCYAELGAAMPEAGGDYVYLSRAFGPLWGFLFGWMISVVERPASIAAIASGFLHFLAFLVPAIDAYSLSVSVPVPLVASPVNVSVSSTQLFAAIVIWGVTGLNYLGVRLGAEFQVGITAVKVFSVLALVALGFAWPHPAVQHQVTNASVTGNGWSTTALVAALVPAMWAYTGFGDLGHLGSEIRRPERNIPRAIVASVFAVTVLYLLVNAVYFHQLSFGQISRSQHVASDVVEQILGHTGAVSLTVVMMLSALGSVNAVVMTGARVPFAMAQDKLFFRRLGHVQPRFHTPGAALLFQAALASLLVLTGTYNELYSLAIFVLSLFFALTAFALIRLRTKEPELVRPYRTWGYPVVPTLFAAVMMLLGLDLLWTQPLRSSVGLVIILLGAPLYRYWRNRASESNEIRVATLPRKE
jgi:basic amino acid/polyamine antiporter, APA family